jgi:hypothetical protein
LEFLAFVDGIPGEGTGLTHPNSQLGHFNITIRAGLIDEPHYDFLATKEIRIFTKNSEVGAVAILDGRTDTLYYVLLHESTRVVDAACKVIAMRISLFGDRGSVELCRSRGLEQDRQERWQLNH